MSDLHLHHVSISVSDLERASAFYRDVLELEPLKRPPFPSAGAWFGGETWQVHLNPNLSEPKPAGAAINPTMPHFALRAPSFDYWIDKLARLGFSENLPADDPKKTKVDRDGIAKFPQLFLKDPDGNVIEINASSL